MNHSRNDVRDVASNSVAKVANTQKRLWLITRARRIIGWAFATRHSDVTASECWSAALVVTSQGFNFEQVWFAVIAVLRSDPPTPYLKYIITPSSSSKVKQIANKLYQTKSQSNQITIKSTN